MAGVVIVGEAKDGDVALVELAASLDPFFKVTLPIDDRLIPDLGLLFDAFSVTESADVGEVGRDGIKLLEKLTRPRHPDVVHQSERNVSLGKRSGEASIEPGLVANLHG